MKIIRELAALFTVAVSSLPSFAQLQLINTRADFPTTDTVNWAVLGGMFATVQSPFTVATTGGSSVTVSHSTGSFQRANQPATWSGNFSFGDALLANGGNNGPMVFDPVNLISGAGFNVQADAHNAIFTFKLEAFDSAGGLIGSVTKNGFSDLNLTVGTAIFIGFVSESLNVDRFVASLVSVVSSSSGAAISNNNFAINTLALSGAAGSSNPVNVAVPEPSVYGLMGAAAIFLLIGRERLRRLSDA
jgi:hypothetical protein